MGHQLHPYKGAVLFIDILGFGALTNGVLKLEKQDLASWILEPNHPKTPQFLAANLLVEFRGILQELQSEFSEVKISQLSDCFFAWSESLKDVVLLAHRYMHLSISRGLLSRGGLAQGEIIETGSNHPLGRLILGKAVTTAVGLEKPAKGARILVDQDFPGRLYQQDAKFADQLLGIFEPFENPLDYQVYDEFRWYVADDLASLPKFGPANSSPEQRLGFTKNRLKLVNYLLHDRKFGWNASNQQGSIHLQATANFLSKNGLNGVSHDFERRSIAGKRGEIFLNKAHNIVENDPVYLIRIN